MSGVAPRHLGGGYDVTRRSSLQARKGSFFNLQTVTCDLERNLRPRVLAIRQHQMSPVTDRQKTKRNLLLNLFSKRSINITINTKYCTKSGLNYLKSGRTSIKDSKGREVDLPHI